MDLTIRLKSLKPTLSDSSCQTYASLLRSLWKQIEMRETISRTSIIKYCQDIVKEIESSNQTTPKKAKQLYSALLVFESPDIFESHDCFLQFRNLIHEHNQKDVLEDEKQVLTSRQQDAYLSWDDIIKRRSELEKDVKDLWDKDHTMDDLWKIQDYVIACLYTMTSPRRLLDYAVMSKYPPVGTGDNGIIRQNGKMFFTFGHYKTSACYGQQVIAVPPALQDVLERWILINPANTLLFHKDLFQVMTSKVLQKKLAQIFKKPGFGVNILRHAFITDKVLQDTPYVSELKEIATQMGHSVPQALLYKKHI